MLRLATLLCFVVLVGFKFIAVQSSFRIAAFNIKKFGNAKMKKPAVVDVLVDVIQRYNIILIQEIQEAAQVAIYNLREEVNSRGPHQYDISMSERLGKTKNKEQYAFLYRASSGDGINVIETHQYSDSQQVFERPPYCVLFGANTEVPEFALVGIHIKPSNAVNEINELAVVHDQISTFWSTENTLIMGDFNADCDYVSNSAKDDLVLRKDPKFKWLLGDEIDTTVGNTDCAYDRFVMTGHKFMDSVVANSVRVFRFDTQYGLNQSFSDEVSDHYPIELQLRSTDSTSRTTSIHVNKLAQLFSMLPAVVKAYTHFISCVI